jgi:protein SCO1
VIAQAFPFFSVRLSCATCFLLRTLFAIVGRAVFWLSVSQALMAQSYDLHQSHRPDTSPAKDTAEKVSFSKASIPDVVLLNQDGEQVRFYSDLVKNKVVAINFIFTTCTTICPPMGAHFSKLQKLMGERVNKDFHLISISVDPLTDTSQRLKAWGEKFNAGPGWTLLTGPKHDVVKLLKALGVFTADKWDHTPLVLIGNEATGRWVRADGLASPAKLAEIISYLNRQ